ncbi:hypothetical protein [Bordetella sp. N]|uniref:hypothetical protein n=1 Tax=Bordetella sp. N TaxID=1746199 RepID=UPI00070EDB52|nr:hypothetical protein [Bordetella sp. N]ALM85510.1 hypothetical protein ASB57_23345 [Bordetella sp. N]
MRTRILRSIVMAGSLLATMTAMAAGPAGAPSATTSQSGAKRPASVPADYVRTSRGYFHPSCVQAVGVGERILGGGKIAKADGTTREYAACKFPRYLLVSGKKIEVGEKLPKIRSEINDPPQMLADMYLDPAKGGVSTFVMTWTVPQNPKVDSGQFLGFNMAAVLPETIMEIETAWNGDDGAGGSVDKGWVLAPWDCCDAGTIFRGIKIPVSPGDEVTGYIVYMEDKKEYNVIAIANGKSSALKTPHYGDFANEVWGGGLGVDSIQDCVNELPASRSVNFFLGQLTTNSGKAVTESFVPYYVPGARLCQSFFVSINPAAKANTLSY